MWQTRRRGQKRMDTAVEADIRAKEVTDEIETAQTMSGHLVS